MVALLSFGVPARANVFEPLLKILLPFYKSDSADSDTKQEDNKTPSEEAKNDNQDNTEDNKQDGKSSGAFDDKMLDEKPLDENSSDAAQKPSNQQVSSPSDSNVITDSTLPNKPLVASVPVELFDDMLTAIDTLPMIDKPDLLALLMAEFAADRGQTKTALTLYKAESFKQNATAVFERALALSIELETPEESLSFARAWMKQNPDHIPTWFYVTHLALKAGEYSQAAQMLTTILDYDPGADLTEILTGIFPNERSEQQALFFALQNIKEQNPSLSVLRAGLLLRLNEYTGALLHVNTALKAQPKNMAFITLKIDILSAMGQDDEKWAFIHQKLKEIPNNTELHLYEIRVLIGQGQLEKAWQLLQVANKQTNDPEVALLTALVGLDANRFAESREVLKPLFQNPNFISRANYYTGISYEREGKMADAYPYFEKVKDFEHVLDARTKVVGYYLSVGNVDKAKATLTRLRDEYEIYATDSYLLEAEILLRQNKKDEALNLLAFANRESPDDDRLLYASYQLLENSLSYDDKRLALNRLLEIDNFNPAYKLADAKLRLTRDPNDENALATARSISEIGVDDPNYESELQFSALVLLADNALGKGNYKSVIEYLEIPYEVAPDLNAGILLLKAYQGLGQSQKVNQLLAELQQRFAFGQNNAGAETQGY